MRVAWSVLIRSPGVIMKKTSKFQKLELNKQTVRQLTPAELDVIVGGWIPIETRGKTCTCYPCQG